MTEELRLIVEDGSHLSASPARTNADGGAIMYAGGSVTYAAYLGSRWVGWVGDGRRWRGGDYGGRRWWCAWREAADTAARWGTDLEFTTRRAAATALFEQVTTGATR